MQSIGRSRTRAPLLTPPLGFDRGVLVQRSRPLLGQSIRNANQATLPAVRQEIDIWRVAVLMVKRYADDTEANADRRADELETEGDSSWRGDLASGHNSDRPANRHIWITPLILVLD